MTGRKNLRLRSEREILSSDGETGGEEEFVVMDLISVEEEKYVFIVEAEKLSWKGDEAVRAGDERYERLQW